LEREFKHIIGKLIDGKYFVFANVLKKVANAHCTHLQITQAPPQPKFAKECNFTSHKQIIGNSPILLPFYSFVYL
jgi:hypothetical protein